MSDASSLRRRFCPRPSAFFGAAQVGLLSLFLLSWAVIESTAAQTPATGLRNGGFESIDEQGQPNAWSFPALFTQGGYVLRVDHGDAFEGDTCVSIDSTAKEAGAVEFGNLMQHVDATRWRGKRVRFRAAVRVEAMSEDGRGQLWFRVDRPTQNGQPMVGAFDNMQDRPIKSDQWRTYDIVADVEDDAERIIVGLLCFGKGVVWIDDASLTEVDRDVASTTMRISAQVGGGASAASKEDPPQPFFNHWLWLAMTGMLLFVISQVPAMRRAMKGASQSSATARRDAAVGSKIRASSLLRTIWLWIQSFALRFTFLYWFLYSLSTVVFTIVPFSDVIAIQYQRTVDLLVRKFAASGLGIEKTLIAPNGSGDTTFAYVQLLLMFLIAIGTALVWTIVMALLDKLTRWGRTHAWRESALEDLLRSFVRYALAFTMLSYGLAKTGWMMNQFPEPTPDRLLSTYGDSSPMGLVWTFMGASRAYTIFAGLGEVVGALLLIWRRTTSLGALVVVGVMSNVVMLNFCYDIPVKQYSAHLLFMAVFLLLPEIPRLIRVFVFNRGIPKADLKPPYTNRYTIWGQRAIKAWIILIGIGLPLWNKAQAEWRQDSLAKEQPEFFGAYEVVSFERDGEDVPPLMNDATRWRYVIFQRSRRFQGGQLVPVDIVSLRMMDGSRLGSLATLSEDQATMTLSGSTAALPKVWKVQLDTDQQLRVNADFADTWIQVTMRPLRSEDFLLTRRGFRWINEYPYNR